MSSVRTHGELLWSGEHWINAIRREGDERPSAWVSLFVTHWSPAGAGHAAHVLIPEANVDALCVDVPETGEFIAREFFARSTYHPPRTPTLAGFRREGSLARDSSWRIEFAGRTVLARWRLTQPAVTATGSFRAGTEHLTVLFFTEDSSVELDGRRIDGKPYPRDIWQASIGGQRSSSVVASPEVMVRTG